jgi:Flp pilus assembly protein TadD
MLFKSPVLKLCSALLAGLSFATLGSGASGAFELKASLNKKLSHVLPLKTSGENDPIQKILLQGRNLLTSDDLLARKEIIVRLERLAETSLKSEQLAEVKFLLASYYQREGQEDATILALTDALILSQEQPSLQFQSSIRWQLAKLYMKRGFWDEAGGLLRKIVELNPQDLQARGNLGICLEQLGFLPLAISEFNQVLRLEPHNFLCLYNLGTAHVTSGNLQQAKPYFERALSEAGTDRERLGLSLLGMARVLEGLKDYRQARVMVDKVLILTPQNHFAYLISARIYQGLNEPGKAYEEVRKAAHLAPKDPGVRQALSGILQKAAPKLAVSQPSPN